MKDVEIKRMAEFELGYWWFVGRRRVVETVLKKELENKSELKILDLGCGTGQTALSLEKFGVVYGTDRSFSALKYSFQNGLNKVVESDSYHLPFKENTFDLVTMLDVLEHVKNDLRALKELKRVLKKNSMILITVPAYQFLWSEHDIALSHYRRYNSHGLAIVLKEAGFRISRISYFISILFPIILAYRSITKLKKDKPNPQTQLISLPKFIDSILQKILFLEAKILNTTNLPFGASIVCIAKISNY